MTRWGMTERVWRMLILAVLCGGLFANGHPVAGAWALAGAILV